MEKKVSSISVLAAYSGRDNGYIFCHDDVRYRGGRVFQVRHFFLGEARFRFFLRATREGAPSFFSWAARVAPRVFRAFEMTLPWRRPRESCARGSRSTTRTSRCARRTKAPSSRHSTPRTRPQRRQCTPRLWGGTTSRRCSAPSTRGSGRTKAHGAQSGGFTCCVTPLTKKIKLLTVLASSDDTFGSAVMEPAVWEITHGAELLSLWIIIFRYSMKKRKRCENIFFGGEGGGAGGRVDEIKVSKASS